MIITPKVQKFLQIVAQSQRLGHLKRHNSYPHIVALTHFLPDNSSVSRRVWHVSNRVSTIPTCKMCNNPAPWEKGKGGCYRTYCSSKCAHTDPVVITKTKQTNIRLYQHESPLHSPRIRQQILTMWKDRYGVDNPAKHPLVKRKIGGSLVKAKNVNINNKSTIIEMINRGLTQQEIGEVLGISQPRVSSLLNKLELKTNNSTGSSPQREVVDLIQSCYSGKVTVDDSAVIPPYHLDIHLPDLKLAIEINGIYWHSEQAGKNSLYHLNKTQLCHQQGIRLIHIWDGEWKNKKAQVQSLILSAIQQNQTVAADQCTVISLSPEDGICFLQAHSLDYPAEADLVFGLCNGENCLAVLGARQLKHNRWEIIYYCEYTGVTVLKGAVMLFNFFKNNISPNDVIMSTNLRWGYHNPLCSAGFVIDHNTEPKCWYFNRSGNCHDLSAIESDDKDRIWDCGSTLWKWRQS